MDNIRPLLITKDGILIMQTIIIVGITLLFISFCVGYVVATYRTLRITRSCINQNPRMVAHPTTYEKVNK